MAHRLNADLRQWPGCIILLFSLELRCGASCAARHYSHYFVPGTFDLGYTQAHGRLRRVLVLYGTASLGVGSISVRTKTIM